MTENKSASVDKINLTNSPPLPPGRILIDVQTVAAKYGADERTIFRWADAGRIPFGLKVGWLRRWDLAEIDAHIANGCRPIRSSKKGG